jgi:hypothetical protein
MAIVEDIIECTRCGQEAEEHFSTRVGGTTRAFCKSCGWVWEAIPAPELFDPDDEVMMPFLYVTHIGVGAVPGLYAATGDAPMICPRSTLGLPATPTEETWAVYMRESDLKIARQPMDPYESVDF